jgi:hypothetical protein
MSAESSPFRAMQMPSRASVSGIEEVIQEKTKSGFIQRPSRKPTQGVQNFALRKPNSASEGEF